MLIAQQPVALFQNITSKQGNPNNKNFKRDRKHPDIQSKSFKHKLTKEYMYK